MSGARTECTFGDNKGTNMTTEHEIRTGHPDRQAAVLQFRKQLNGMTWVSLRVHTRVLQTFGLTTFQALAIKALADTTAPVDMAHLAELTAVPPSTLTTVIDRLERDGYAERGRHPKDRRKVLVVLTESGHDLLRRTEAAGLRLTVDMLREVTDHDLQVVNGVVEQMSRSIEAIDAEPDRLKMLLAVEN